MSILHINVYISPLAAVNMYPSGTFVSVLDGSFQVVCSSDSTMQLTDVQWLVNGSPLENLNLHAETNISRENGYGYLRFNNNLQRKHNNSVISCTATFDSDEMQSPLQFSKLIIQGWMFYVFLDSCVCKRSAQPYCNNHDAINNGRFLRTKI